MSYATRHPPGGMSDIVAGITVVLVVLNLWGIERTPPGRRSSKGIAPEAEQCLTQGDEQRDR